MTIEEQKKSLRKTMHGNRNQVDRDFKDIYDNWICNELEQLIIDREYKIVHAYIPLATEINIGPLLQELLSLKITVVCPKTLPKRKLENRILNHLDDLEVGIMGTMHPARANTYDGKFDLIIVPGLAFDQTNYRLGYGGGYYDNFLATKPEAYKVGIFYPFQKVTQVPIEPHDICLDTILVNEF